jgi:hypothetical protein
MSMLKLKDASYPEPERPVLHEQTYDLGKDGSKWAHGYVPLNPAAVALKHHKQPGGSDGGTAKGLASRDSGSSHKLASRASIGDSSGTKGRFQIRESSYRGQAGHTISGTDAQGRKPKVFTDRGRADAEQVKANLQAGKEPFAHHAKPTAAKSDRESRIASARAVLDRGEHDSVNPPSSRERDEAKATLRELGSKRQVTVKRDSFAPTRSVDEHVKLAIAHNEAGKRALDRGDKAAAERHVAKSREHNAAAIEGGNAILGRNAIDRATLEGHAKALAVPYADRTPEQQAAADKALAYAKELRAKRLAKKAPPKIKATGSGLRGTSVTKREQAATGTSARKRNLLTQKQLFGK